MVMVTLVMVTLVTLIPCSMDRLKKLGEDIGDTSDIYDGGLI